MTDTPRFAGFRIVEELGSGALTSVYKAVQESLDRVVAIKVLKPTIHPTSPFAAQLEREARVLGELSHPNVGLLYDFVKEGDTGRMYVVLEYVDGFSLATVLAKKTKMPPEVVAAIGAEVARGLAHVHERGIVHRDIKPANLLVSKRGDVKIFDFGIARRVRAGGELPDPLGSSRMADADEQLAKLEENAAFGTPAYMSPEQILGEKVDARSDIFSLGTVLYQLLCGARPFDKGDENDRRAAAQRIRRDPPVPLHRRAPDVPRPLERIVMRAIEKLPIDRYQTAEALAEHLDAYVQSKARAPRHALVARALVKAGLVPGDANAIATPQELKPRASVRPAVQGLAAIFALVVVGGAIVQWTGRGGAHRVTAGDEPLELSPKAAGALRVLARPWAEVWVDGQRIDVTPFARAIPLTPGKHFVTFKHPSAPTEKREIDVVANETITLDVTMAIGGAAVGAASASASASSASAGDAAADSKSAHGGSR